MNNIDLKLLSIIAELNKTRSVSRAAENLNSSQSTISMSLAKLRRHFNDPLFVRTSAGMEPTPHATELICLVKEAERLLGMALQHHVVFNPATSNRTFRVASTDITQHTIIPGLLNRLRETAPLVCIDLLNMSCDTPHLLESGRVDLAVGFITDMGAGFFQQKLFRERFVCAVRSSHPRIGESLDLESFEHEHHIAVATSGTGHSIVETTLEVQHIVRRIGLRVSTFLGIASILRRTDFIAIVPEQLGRLFRHSGGIKLLELPFVLPEYHITQHWHERYRHDPGSRWLRETLTDLFGPPAPVSESEPGYNPLQATDCCF